MSLSAYYLEYGRHVARLVVVRTRPRALPLPMITMRKSISFSYMVMGLRLAVFGPPELRYNNSIEYRGAS